MRRLAAGGTLPNSDTLTDSTSGLQQQLPLYDDDLSGLWHCVTFHLVVAAAAAVALCSTLTHYMNSCFVRKKIFFIPIEFLLFDTH